VEPQQSPPPETEDVTNTTAHPRVYVPRSAKRKRGRPIKRRRKAAAAAGESNIGRIATPTATKDDVKLKMIPTVVCKRLDSLLLPPRSCRSVDKKLKMIPTVVCKRLDSLLLPPRPRRSVHNAIQIGIADDKLKLVPRVLCTRLKLGKKCTRPPRPAKRLRIAMMVTWNEQSNEAIVRHALGLGQDVDNLYF